MSLELTHSPNGDDSPITEVKPSPNVLRGTRCYLIGHMEYANGRDWRKYVIDELGPRGITFFNPYHKPFVNDIPEDENAREEMARWRDTEQWDRAERRPPLPPRPSSRAPARGPRSRT